jgi:hypothetical protein
VHAGCAQPRGDAGHDRPHDLCRGLDRDGAPSGEHHRAGEEGKHGRLRRHRRVAVTDAYGHSDSWHTDGSGYADVYFKTGGSAPGRQTTARVGQATCSAML